MFARPQSRVRFGVVASSALAAEALRAAARPGSDSEVVAIQVEDAPFDGYRELLASAAIDAVYLGSCAPRLLSYVVAAIEAGVHVLCEEPPAACPSDYEALARAARGHASKPIVACRRTLSPVHRTAADLVDSRLLGEPHLFSAVACSPQGNPDVLAAECISQARRIFHAEPCQVLSTARCEWTAYVSVGLRFAGGRLALLACGSAQRASFRYDVVASHGQLRVCSAPGERGHDELYTTLAGVTTQRRFPREDAFAAELSRFSASLLTRSALASTLRDALANAPILSAIGEASRQGTSVRLKRLQNGRGHAADAVVSTALVSRPLGEPGPALASPA